MICLCVFICEENGTLIRWTSCKDKLPTELENRTLESIENSLACMQQIAGVLVGKGENEKPE